MPYSLLDDELIRYRSRNRGKVTRSTLPRLLSLMGGPEGDEQIGDFPGLRAHQRHPLHAFLAQLAAIALHKSGLARSADLASLKEADWKELLLAITPEQERDTAWCLLADDDERCAFMQPGAPGGIDAKWDEFTSPDAIDVLVTAKNHELKSAVMTTSEPDDWIFTLISLQTQGGYDGPGHRAIVRMNGGSSSRPGVGIVSSLGLCADWRRDVAVLLEKRDFIAERFGLSGGADNSLLWMKPWDGTDPLSFNSLDPYFIEICRRVRLKISPQSGPAALVARKKPSAANRVDAGETHGLTGDPWTPIDTVAAKSLTISANGWGYKLASELLFGEKYTPGVCQTLAGFKPGDGDQLWLLMRGLARGQGKTEGFHERRVPIAPKVRSLLGSGQRGRVAAIASERIKDIGEVRKLLWRSILILLGGGESASDPPETQKQRASLYADSFEKDEDARFFADLTDEVDVLDSPEGAEAVRLAWQVGLVARGRYWLEQSFVAGPQSSMVRFKARAAAQGLFLGSLRGSKSPLKLYAQHLKKIKSEPSGKSTLQETQPLPESTQ